MQMALRHSIQAWHDIRSKDLLPLHASPWEPEGREDQTWVLFDYLLGFFQPVLEELWHSLQSSSNAKGSGRKHLLWAEDVLGLTLMWIHVPAYHDDHVMLMQVFALGQDVLLWCSGQIELRCLSWQV
jgi:hypothetical protein